jgi:hypothetical protein
MRPGIPSYATLCELGSFQGYSGLEEVYELDGRRYRVTEEFGRDGPYFSVSSCEDTTTEVRSTGRSQAA